MSFCIQWKEWKTHFKSVLNKDRNDYIRHKIIEISNKILPPFFCLLVFQTLLTHRKAENSGS